MTEGERRARRAAYDVLARAKSLDAELAGAGFRPPSRPPTAPLAAAPTAQPADPMGQFDALVTDPDLNAWCRTLYRDGHHARAVEEAFKFLANHVKGQAGDATRDGQDLMLHVFSVENPVLRLNDLRRTSQRDEQAGYRFMLAGAMTGIRNPRAHEHTLRDQADVALEMLVLANHLMRVVRRSTRVRRRRANPRAPAAEPRS
jgi:uncharacterized protein (TIGR02391 family)